MVITVITLSVPLLVHLDITVWRELEQTLYHVYQEHITLIMVHLMNPTAYSVYLVCIARFMEHLPLLAPVLLVFTVLLVLMCPNLVVNMWVWVVCVHQVHTVLRVQASRCHVKMEHTAAFLARWSVKFALEVIIVHQIQ